MGKSEATLRVAFNGSFFPRPAADLQHLKPIPERYAALAETSVS
jgi:hypothetical protein